MQQANNDQRPQQLSFYSNSKSNNSLFKKVRQNDVSPDSGIKEGLGLRSTLNVLQNQLVNLCDGTPEQAEEAVEVNNMLA